MLEDAAEQLAGDVFEALHEEGSAAVWYAVAAFTRALQVAQETYITLLMCGESDAIARQDALAAARDDTAHRRLLDRLAEARRVVGGVSDGTQ